MNPQTNIYGIYHEYHNSPSVFVSTKHDTDSIVDAVAFIHLTMERIITNISFDQSEIAPFLVKYYGCVLESNINEDAHEITYINIDGARDEKAGKGYQAFMRQHPEKYGKDALCGMETEINDYLYDTYARNSQSMLSQIYIQQRFDRIKLLTGDIRARPIEVDAICMYIAEKNQLDMIYKHDSFQTDKELRARFSAPRNGIEVDFIITPEKHVFIQDMNQYEFDVSGVTRNLQYGEPYNAGGCVYCRREDYWEIIWRNPAYPQSLHKFVTVTENTPSGKEHIKDMTFTEAAEEIIKLSAS